MKAALIWNSPALPGRQLRITRPHLYWLAALMAGALAATLWIALTALEFVQQGNGALDTHMAAGGLLLLALGALVACVACLLLLYELRPQE
jgi:hypothetical protein